jgi:hydrogenase maturation protein HypF
MVRTTAEVHELARLTDAEEALLESPERPIVLVDMIPNGPLAGAIAPGLTRAGVMLAYTPLHVLLLNLVDRPLVMTSGNVSDEPIAAGCEDALERLHHIADGFLLHDRDIVNRFDDSVMSVSPDGDAIVLRRARGYAPRPVSLPVATPEPLMAVGPQLKSTFTLAHGNQAFVSQHLGDLENLSTLQHFQISLARYQRLFRIRPTVAVRDLHPGYLSTRIADELGLDRVMAVQHHHAHIAAVMGEHGLVEPVLGVAYDGTGYGDDGTVWGAEIMVADLTQYRRVAHLRPAPLPGGDAAVRAPWRVALGYRSLEPTASDDAFAHPLSVVHERERAIVEQQLARRLNAPMASSMGRLFDAAASVLGLCQEIKYEGQAAMELEALAGWRASGPLPYAITAIDDRWVLDPLPILVALGERRAAGVDPADLAAAFHDTIIAATAELLHRVREASGLCQVVVSGGSFQNIRLHMGLRHRLAAEGYTVLAPLELSPNDGAVSYGQAVVAAARLHTDPTFTASRRD